MNTSKAVKVKKTLLNNSMYIIICVFVLFVVLKDPTFVGVPSLVNILALTAVKLPLAIGVAGCLILEGTDLSAGRAVGLTACFSAALLTTTFKVFPAMTEPMPVVAVLFIVLGIGAGIGFVNGFCTSKFKLHPFIVTLAMQLILYGLILIFLMRGTNAGQTLSDLTEDYRNAVAGPLFVVGGVSFPKYILYAIIAAVVMWVVWNKTSFGRCMYAVGSNRESARVSGVNVSAIIIGVFTIAGVLYALTGFIDAARIASANATTGFNYELDAIAACVIGGVSFSGGSGKIGGIVVGVLLMQLIFTGLTFLSVDSNMLYVIKGLIIIAACAIDIRKAK